MLESMTSLNTLNMNESERRFIRQGSICLLILGQYQPVGRLSVPLKGPSVIARQGPVSLLHPFNRLFH